MKRLKFSLFLVFALLFLFSTSLHAWVKPTASEIALDNAIADLTGLLRFSDLINPTPSSSAQEKTEFLEKNRIGKRYEPQFSYEPVSKKAMRAVARLKRVPAPDGVYKDFLENAREQLLKKVDILSARGSDGFSRLAKELYALPSPKEIVQARNFIVKHGIVTKAKEKTLTDKDMANELETALKEHGLSEWGVRISSKMSASASVLPVSRTIKIREGVSFCTDDVVRLVHHEIGVHARRAENGHSMPLKIFSSGLDGYLETEEGMATINEERHDIHEGLMLFAFRVLAVDWASRLSFSKVFENLRKMGVEELLAWNLTQRVKRGMTETGIAGCYPKDVSYFRGYLTIKKNLAGNGDWEALMRFGKVSIEHVPALLKLEN